MSESNPLVVTIDLGTQSVRALLVDKTGQILHITQQEYPEDPVTKTTYYSLHPGWAEQKPEVYWNGACDVVKQLKEEAKELWNAVVAVTITTIRDTCICVNKDGKPLRDVIVWLDKREAKMSKPFSFIHRLLFRLVGMTDTAILQRKISACNWIIENEPNNWARTHKFMFISGYLTYLLTGRLADSTANMVGHIPFSSKTRKWMSAFDLNRALFDIENEKLSELLEPGKTLGYITEKAAEETGLAKGLPLIATGSDIGCTTIGLSCTKPDSAAISLGTTATIQFTIKKYMEPLPFIPGYPAVLEKHYNPEYMVYRGYWLISEWFINEIARLEKVQFENLRKDKDKLKEYKERGLDTRVEERLNKSLSKIPPGCDGLIFQPFFTPGVVMPKAIGSWIGFTDVHTREHMYRSVIEGINFALYEGLKTMEKRGKVKIKKLFVAGGGSQDNTICQITADMFGLPVYRIQTHQVAGLGSSMVAFVSAGVYKDIHEAAKNMVHIKDEFKPDMKIHESYKLLYKDVYSKVFNKLIPLYRNYEAHKNAKTV